MVGSRNSGSPSISDCLELLTNEASTWWLRVYSIMYSNLVWIAKDKQSHSGGQISAIHTAAAFVLLV